MLQTPTHPSSTAVTTGAPRKSANLQKPCAVLSPQKQLPIGYNRKMRKGKISDLVFEVNDASSSSAITAPTPHAIAKTPELPEQEYYQITNASFTACSTGDLERLLFLMGPTFWLMGDENYRAKLNDLKNNFLILAVTNETLFNNLFKTHGTYLSALAPANFDWVSYAKSKKIKPVEDTGEITTNIQTLHEEIKGKQKTGEDNFNTYWDKLLNSLKDMSPSQRNRTKLPGVILDQFEEDEDEDEEDRNDRLEQFIKDFKTAIIERNLSLHDNGMYYPLAIRAGKIDIAEFLVECGVSPFAEPLYDFLPDEAQYEETDRSVSKAVKGSFEILQRLLLSQFGPAPEAGTMEHGVYAKIGLTQQISEAAWQTVTKYRSTTAQPSKVGTIITNTDVTEIEFVRIENPNWNELDKLSSFANLIVEATQSGKIMLPPSPNRVSPLYLELVQELGNIGNTYQQLQIGNGENQLTTAQQMGPSMKALTLQMLNLQFNNPDGANTVGKEMLIATTEKLLKSRGFGAFNDYENSLLVRMANALLSSAGIKFINSGFFWNRELATVNVPPCTMEQAKLALADVIGSIENPSAFDSFLQTIGLAPERKKLTATSVPK